MLIGKTFFVTGSTGQLGSHTVARLEELGATVVPIVLEGYPVRPKREEWKSRAEPVVLSDASSLNGLPDPDYLINYHWRLDAEGSITTQLLFQLEYNIHRPAFLWDWLVERPLKTFVNISSIKVFGNLNSNPIAAETEPMPATPYGIAKLAGEKFFDACFSRNGCMVSHLRLCSVTSASEHPSKMMNRICASAFEHRHIRLNAGHRTCLIYIDDMVDIIINAALTADRNRYILTSEGIDIEDIARRFEQISRRRLNVEYVNLDPNVTDPVFVSDIPRLRAEWTRSTSIETMIGKVIGQYLANSSRKPPRKKGARTSKLMESIT